VKRVASWSQARLLAIFVVSLYKSILLSELLKIHISNSGFWCKVYRYLVALGSYGLLTTLTWCKTFFEAAYTIPKVALSPQKVPFTTKEGKPSVFPLIIPHAYMTYMTMLLLSNVVWKFFGREAGFALFGWFWAIPDVGDWCKVISFFEIVIGYTLSSGIEPLPARLTSDKSAEQRDDPSSKD